MKHVKENELVHGEFGDWADSIGIGRYQVSRFIKVAEELAGAKLQTSASIGLDALYLIATMPESDRTQTHTIPSTGEEKKPEDMTVRELREVKRALKEAEQAREQAEQQAEQAQMSEEIVRSVIEHERKEFYVFMKINVPLFENTCPYGVGRRFKVIYVKVRRNIIRLLFLLV